MVVLGSIRKQAEQATGSKLVSSTPPWPLQVPALFEFPTAFVDELLHGSMSEVNPPLPKLLWLMVLHHSNSNPDYDKQ